MGKAKVQIVNMITYRETLDDGDIFETVIDPKGPPENERAEDHPGMAWHPILERWVPEADVNKPMLVDEDEILPSERQKEDESED